MSLARKRCFNHSDREAVACCLECGNFYCRECITEHDDRLICSTCLREQGKPSAKAMLAQDDVLVLLSVIFGFAVAWLCFYLTAQILLSVEDESFDDSSARIQQIQHPRFNRRGSPLIQPEERS